MTEWARQDFSALELGPGCLVLGIDGGPPRVWKVPMSLLRNVEELMAFPVSVGTNGASRCGDTHWTALEKVHVDLLGDLLTRRIPMSLLLCWRSQQIVTTQASTLLSRSVISENI